MTYENNLKPIIENKKPVELVQELKDEYKIPTFEEFNKTYNENKRINDNYQDEFDSYDDLRVIRSYGPGNGLSTEGEERAKTASKWVAGTFLTIETLVCPPAGLATAAAWGGAGLAAKGATRLADKDSKVREAGDTFNELTWNSIGTSAKQQMIIQGGKVIYKTL